MWARISSTDRDEIMPQLEAHKVMKPKEREIPSSSGFSKGRSSENIGPTSPLRENPVPATGKEWPHSLIDWFVFAKLKEKY